jgi:dTDP-4-dehydrorhamnose reductase
VILLTGGSGRLGSLLRDLIPQCYAPSHSRFDILEPDWPLGIEAVVHCAAFTDVAAAQDDRMGECYSVNVLGTYRMSRYPICYISTEYVFSGEEGNYREDAVPDPVNWYARTKLMGEWEARKAPSSLILRTIFKPRPYPHQRVPADMWTSGDYVDVIAPRIAAAVQWWRAGRLQPHDTLHIGTGRKQLLALAQQSREDIVPTRRSDIKTPLPRDTSLDTRKYDDMAAR